MKLGAQNPCLRSSTRSRADATQKITLRTGRRMSDGPEKRTKADNELEPQNEPPGDLYPKTFAVDSKMLKEASSFNS